MTKIIRNIFVRLGENVQILVHSLAFLKIHFSVSSHPTLSGVAKIFYRVVTDIAPGEELLLFMKSEDYPHETMAPDIHGE